MPEQVLYAIPVHERRGFRSPEQYALVVTDLRTILVPFSKESLKQAGADAKEQARAEGKGFFGRWGAQVVATMGYAQQFLTMEPDAIARQAGAVAIDNASVVSAGLAENSDEDSSSTSWTVHLKTPDGARKFELRAQPGGLAAAMKQAYRERLRG